MKKKIVIILAVLALIIVIGVFAYSSVTGSSTVAAQVHVESGNVMVNGKAVTGKVVLKEGDLIETGDDGLATVILYESVVVSLDPKTNITLSDLTKQHPQVSQEDGRTWNKFTKLSGVEDYSIKTGNSVASVRATAFSFEKGKVITGEGEVIYTIDGQNFSVKGKKVVEVVNGKAVEREATKEEIDFINKKMGRSIKELKYLRQLEIEKHPSVMKVIKSKNGFTDEDIAKKLEEADEGKIDIDEIASKSPIKIDSVKKVAEITKAIKKINDDTKALNA